jgi:hypothetical protein
MQLTNSFCCRPGTAATHITPSEASRSFWIYYCILECDFDGRLYPVKENQTLTLALPMESDAMK